MGVVKVLKEKDLQSGTSDNPVYPATSTKAVFNEDNVSVDMILKKNLLTNISTNYSANVIPLTLQEAINIVPNKDKKLGYIGTFKSKDFTPNRWAVIQYNGEDTSIPEWTNIDNWKYLISENDVTNEEGNSESLIMSQKAVTEYVDKKLDINKYNLDEFKKLTVGGDATKALTPIGGDSVLVPTLNDILLNSLKYCKIIYTSYGAQLTNYIISYIDDSICTTITINMSTRIVEDIKYSRRLYDLDLISAITSDTSYKDVLTALIPIGETSTIIPSAGDILVGNSETATFSYINKNSRTVVTTIYFDRGTSRFRLQIDGRSRRILLKEYLMANEDNIELNLYSILALTSKSTAEEIKGAFGVVSSAYLESFINTILRAKIYAITTHINSKARINIDVYFSTKEVDGAGKQGIAFRLGWENSIYIIFLYKSSVGDYDKVMKERYPLGEPIIE